MPIKTERHRIIYIIIDTQQQRQAISNEPNTHRAASEDLQKMLDNQEPQIYNLQRLNRMS